MAGVLKYWNGSAWAEVEVSAPQGPTGPTGPTGPAGPMLSIADGGNANTAIRLVASFDGGNA